MKPPASRPPALIFQSRIPTLNLGRVHVRIYAAPTGEGVSCVCVPGSKAPAVSPATATRLAEEIRRRVLVHVGGRPGALRVFLPYPPDSSGRERWARAIFALPGRRRQRLDAPTWAIVGRGRVAELLDR